MIRDPETADTADLDGMTKAQLLSYAGNHGVGGVTGSMRKADIRAVIEEAIL